MSQQRPRRSSLPPERFRPLPSVDPPQHAVARARPSSALVPVPSDAPRVSPSRMVAPRLVTSCPPQQDLPPVHPPVGAQIVQHVHQQFFFSTVPTAVARPVLPVEDLWSVEGLRAHASAPPAAPPSKWHHGRRAIDRTRTALLPAAPPSFPDPQEQSSEDVLRPCVQRPADASSSTALEPTLLERSASEPAGCAARAGMTAASPAVFSGLVADVLAYAASQSRGQTVAVGVAALPQPAVERAVVSGVAAALQPAAAPSSSAASNPCTRAKHSARPGGVSAILVG
ncbi:hypothetical protein AB1Y20_014993 [Prymnesium parvum]|uniref:Uncharacterized protein n=1 Tax=Prymnesium parvum TaxID=97485 RepID=A0AB34JWJ2_PRYPA